MPFLYADFCALKRRAGSSHQLGRAVALASRFALGICALKRHAGAARRAMHALEPPNLFDLGGDLGQVFAGLVGGALALPHRVI